MNHSICADGGWAQSRLVFLSVSGWNIWLAACSIVLSWTILYFVFISLSSDKASLYSCLLTPVLFRAVPVQKAKKAKVMKDQNGWKRQISGMFVLKATSLLVVLPLISLIISSTLSFGCFIGFRGGRSLICVQKFLKSQHEGKMLFLVFYSSSYVCRNLTATASANENEFCVAKYQTLFSLSLYGIWMLSSFGFESL